MTIHATIKQGHTPLHLTDEVYGSEETCVFLIQQSANTTLRNYKEKNLELAKNDPTKNPIRDAIKQRKNIECRTTSYRYL